MKKAMAARTSIRPGTSPSAAMTGTASSSIIVPASTAGEPVCGCGIDPELSM